MRTATVYNFLIEANIMASLAILLMIPIRKFLRPAWAAGRCASPGCWWRCGCCAR